MTGHHSASSARERRRQLAARKASLATAPSSSAGTSSWRLSYAICGPSAVRVSRTKTRNAGDADADACAGSDADEGDGGGVSSGDSEADANPLVAGAFSSSMARTSSLSPAGLRATLAALDACARSGDASGAEALILSLLVPPPDRGPPPAALAEAPAPADARAAYPPLRAWALLARSLALGGLPEAAAAVPSRALAAASAAGVPPPRLDSLVASVIRALGEAGLADAAAAAAPLPLRPVHALPLLEAYAASGRLPEARATFGSLPLPRSRWAHYALAAAHVVAGYPEAGASHVLDAAAAGEVALPWRRVVPAKPRRGKPPGPGPPPLPPQVVELDLHGLTQASAAAVLRAALRGLAKAASESARHVAAAPQARPGDFAVVPAGIRLLPAGILELHVITGRGLGSKLRMRPPVREAAEETLRDMRLPCVPLPANPGVLRLRRGPLGNFLAIAAAEPQEDQGPPPQQLPQLP